MKLIDFSSCYKTAAQLHSWFPVKLGSTWALPPFFVQIEVTHQCNLDCPVCYQKTKLGSDGEMTLEEIKRLIDQLPHWCVLSLTGGEPFVRNDFTEILEYGLGKRKCTVLTNGSLVSDLHIDTMVRNRLLLLAVSLDGVGETHDRIRKCTGLSDKVVKTIRAVQERKKEDRSQFPLIDVKCVILKENVGEFHDLLMLADSLSADFITFSLPRRMDCLYSAPYHDDLEKICGTLPGHPWLTQDELKLMSSQIVAIKKYAGKTRVRFYPANMMDKDVLRKHYQQETSFRDFRACSLPWSRMSISPHGDVYPCLSYRVGNARLGSLRDIWNGPDFRAFRKHMGRECLSGFCFGCCNSVYAG